MLSQSSGRKSEVTGGWEMSGRGKRGEGEADSDLDSLLDDLLLAIPGIATLVPVTYSPLKVWKPGNHTCGSGAINTRGFIMVNKNKKER